MSLDAFIEHLDGEVIQTFEELQEIHVAMWTRSAQAQALLHRLDELSAALRLASSFRGAQAFLRGGMGGVPPMVDLASPCGVSLRGLGGS